MSPQTVLYIYIYGWTRMSGAIISVSIDFSLECRRNMLESFGAVVIWTFFFGWNIIINTLGLNGCHQSTQMNIDMRIVFVVAKNSGRFKGCKCTPLWWLVINFCVHICTSPSNDYTAVACSNNKQAQLHTRISVPYWSPDVCLGQELLRDIQFGLPAIFHYM